MWKIIIVAVVVVLALAGAALLYQEVAHKESNKVSSKTQVESAAEKLGATDKSDAYYLMLGAEYGAKYKLDNEVVEIYQHKNPASASEGASFFSNVNADVRQVKNMVYVFHGYEEDDPAVDTLIKKVQ